MPDSADYTFVCPECAESILVNDSMRDALLANGCVVCGSPVSRQAFSNA
jgi:predicted nucleic acid-binding Zn ribbon protein